MEFLEVRDLNCTWKAKNLDQELSAMKEEEDVGKSSGEKGP